MKPISPQTRQAGTSARSWRSAVKESAPKVRLTLVQLAEQLWRERHRTRRAAVLQEAGRSEFEFLLAKLAQPGGTPKALASRLTEAEIETLALALPVWDPKKLPLLCNVLAVVSPSALAAVYLWNSVQSSCDPLFVAVLKKWLSTIPATGRFELTSDWCQVLERALAAQAPFPDALANELANSTDGVLGSLTKASHPLEIEWPLAASVLSKALPLLSRGLDADDAWRLWFTLVSFRNVEDRHCLLRDIVERVDPRDVPQWVWLRLGSGFGRPSWGGELWARFEKSRQGEFETALTRAVERCMEQSLGDEYFADWKRHAVHMASAGIVTGTTDRVVLQFREFDVVLICSDPSIGYVIPVGLRQAVHELGSSLDDEVLADVCLDVFDPRTMAPPA